MKKLILSIVVAASVMTACKSEKNKVEAKEKVEDVQKVDNVIDTYKASVADSKISWKGTKPTGAHEGTVNLASGIFDFENGMVKSGEFVIDMKSVTCTDLDADNGKTKLEDHLKSADFFDIDNHPTAKFVVASSEMKDGKLHVTGNLTLRGVTKSITIPASVSKTDEGANFKSDVFSIDRTDFGVTYSSKKFDAALKDKFINDLMELSFDIKAIK